MTGIADMFNEFSTIDGYQLQFDFERYVAWQRQSRRDAQQRYQYTRKGIETARRQEAKPARQEYKRNWVREYDRRKRRTDPVYVAKRRASNRAYAAKVRARLRMEAA